MIYVSDKLGYYKSLLNLEYDNAVQSLIKKYGAALDDYFKESSYNKFLNGEVKSPTKSKTSRTKDGLYCHHIHIDEDKFLNGHAGQKLRSLNGKLSLNVTETQNFDLDFGKSLQNSKATPNKTRTKKQGDFLRDNHRNSFALTHNGLFGDVSTTSFVSS